MKKTAEKLAQKQSGFEALGWQGIPKESQAYQALAIRILIAVKLLRESINGMLPLTGIWAKSGH